MKLLDLFCGGGGSAMGYHRAGFTDITGVDIDARHAKYYPFNFVCDDALEYVKNHWHEYDAINASPPCQKFVTLAENRSVIGKRKHNDKLTPTIELLDKISKPYVIENVPTAKPLQNCSDVIRLCGSSFGLKVRRHRLFKINFFVPSLPCRHKEQKEVVGVYGMGGYLKPEKNPRWFAKKRYRDKAHASEAMGNLDWMTLYEIIEAIPPAYTEYIGKYLIEYIHHK